MMKRVSKITQLKATRQAERKMLASKMDWHLRQLTEGCPLYENVSHELAIQECRVKMHQLKKFV